VKVRLDGKATSLSILVALGVRRDEDRASGGSYTVAGGISCDGSGNKNAAISLI